MTTFIDYNHLDIWFFFEIRICGDKSIDREEAPTVIEALYSGLISLMSLLVQGQKKQPGKKAPQTSSKKYSI